jgi:hypothetical protein
MTENKKNQTKYANKKIAIAILSHFQIFFLMVLDLNLGPDAWAMAAAFCALFFKGVSQPLPGQTLDCDLPTYVS